MELVASQLEKFHEVHEPCIQQHLVDECSMLSPLKIQHSWPNVGNIGSNYEHMHGPTLTSSQEFIYISSLLHELDKSLSSVINFDDFFNSPYIAGTTYTNNDNITILAASSSPYADKTHCILNLPVLSFFHVGFHQLRRSDEV